MNKNTKKIGRPSTISQKAIIDAAYQLLQAEGEKGLSMRKIAKRLNVTATSIYGYFKSKDSLLAALANHFYDNITLALNSHDTSWQQTVETWLNNWRAHIQAAPEAMILAGILATTPRGLHELEKLAHILLPITNNNESEAVAEAQSLFWTVLSFCSFEHMASAPSVVKHLQSTMEENTNSILVKHLAIDDNFDAMWKLTVARNIRGLSPR